MAGDITYSTFESRYRDKKYIGAGGFGKVYKVFDHAKNHYVALKVSDVRPEWNKFTLKNEVELVNKLNHHRNIARYDACYRFNTGITGEMDFAILKFYEHGNLEQFLKQHDLEPEDKRLIIAGVLHGLSFLHQNNVVHRDLKAENILMTREDGVWTPKITDFGLSREIEDVANITNSAVGISYAYAAPEQILNQKIYRNVDLWAVGVIIYRIIAGELPFSGKHDGDHKSVNSQLEISKKIVSNELPDKLETLPQPYRSIIKRCFVTDPLSRAQAPSELLELLAGDSALSQDPNAAAQLSNQNSTVSAMRSETNTHTDEKTVVKEDPKPEDKIELDENVTAIQDTADYQIPSQNQTQFIPQSATAPEAAPAPPPPIVKEFQPEKGGDKKSSVARPILIVLAIAILATGVWWAINSGGSGIDASSPHIQKSNVEFIPQTKSAPTYSFDRYESLAEENVAASENPDELAQLQLELNSLVNTASNAKNYRLAYILAMNQSLQNKSKSEIIKSLEKSARIAANNKSADALIQDMTNDEQGIFADISTFQNGKRWNRIKSALAKHK